MLVQDIKPYVINLKHRIDRLNRMIPLLEENFPQGYEIFEGIQLKDGSAGFVQGSLTKGQAGCFHSHKAVIQRAKELDLPYVLILEDDVAFDTNFIQKFQKFLNLMPKSWEMLYLGGNHQAQVRVFKQDLYSSAILATCPRIYATSSYMVHSRVYDEILNLPFSMPIDVEYGKIQCRGYTFTCYPSIVWQALDDYSDVDGCMSSNRQKDTRLI